MVNHFFAPHYFEGKMWKKQIEITIVQNMLEKESFLHLTKSITMSKISQKKHTMRAHFHEKKGFCNLKLA